MDGHSCYSITAVIQRKHVGFEILIENLNKHQHEKVHWKIPKPFKAWENFLYAVLLEEIESESAFTHGKTPGRAASFWCMSHLLEVMKNN